MLSGVSVNMSKMAVFKFAISHKSKDPLLLIMFGLHVEFETVLAYFYSTVS